RRWYCIIVGEYVVAFLLKNPIQFGWGFLFLYDLKKAVSASRASDGSGILLRDTQSFFFALPFSRKRYSKQHGPPRRETP
ncbi:MAG: hypothetical protein REI96_18815, partial [Flavobacterium nitrogenifigens]